MSGNTILNNFTTINAPLYINTYQSTTISALNVNSSTVGIMVNLIQNTPWNVGINYALNVTGYSNFGGVQIFGLNTAQYRRNPASIHREWIGMYQSVMVCTVRIGMYLSVLVCISILP